MRTHPVGPSSVGLVVARDNHIVAAEPYHHELITGIDRVIGESGMSVFFQVATNAEDASASYRRWAAGGKVACVVVGATTVDNAGFELLDELRMPAVVLGAPTIAPNLSHVWSDESGTMQQAVEFFANAGHMLLGHVAGPESVMHTHVRRNAFLAECELRSLLGQAEQGDYSVSSGRDATLRLLSQTPAPTAIIYDNDLMAIGGLQAATERGISVPRGLSILAWDDSVKCQLADPPISALQHDIQEIGELVGDAVLGAVAGVPPQSRQASPSTIRERETT